MNGIGYMLYNLIRQNWAPLLVLGLLAGAWLFLRTPADDLSVEVFHQEIRSGRPTVVEFFSNTCSVCLMSKPAVDRLERELDGKAKLLRINVMSQSGLALAREYDVVAVPTFIVFDGKGQVVYAQAGPPDRGAIRAAVTGLGGPE